MEIANLTTPGTTTTLLSTPAEDGFTGEEIAEIFFRILIYTVGVVGNLLVIFVILFLNEFQKITHWYVLQLAVADILFLQTMPFRVSEIVHGGWIHSEQMCQAKQTILYFNYYASILFLMIMAVDRYLAVCHALSSRIQRMRSRVYSFVVTGVTWTVALLMCIPVMLYSAMVGIKPNCQCSLDFPKDKERWCGLNYADDGEEGIRTCVNETYDSIFGGSACSSPGSTADGEPISGDIYDWFEDSGNLFSGLPDVNDFGSGFLENGTRVKRETLHGGCYYKTDHGLAQHAFIYFNFFVMFVLPLIVISTCYVLIVNRLMSTNVGERRTSNADSAASVQGSRKKIWTAGRRRSSSTGNTYREKIRVTVLCALLVVLFIVCWLPFHSVHLARIVGIVTDDPQLCVALGKATSMLAYLNSALNPYLYNFLGSFQKRMKQIRNHKRMQSFLSATGLTRLGGRSNSIVNSSDSSKGKRHSVPNESRSGSIPNEKKPLKTLEEKSTTVV